MPDDWDDSKPDWATKQEYGVPDQQAMLETPEQQQTMYQFSYGDYDTKPKSEGETDQDCCDNAKETWLKGQERWLRSKLDELIQEAKDEYHDGQGLDAFFDEIQEMNEKAAGITGEYTFDPKEIEADRQEAIAEIEKHYNDQFKPMHDDKARIINSMDCGDFKMFVKQAATTGQGDMPPIMAQTAVQVYKEWMDCEGTDFGGDDDMFMAGEPMDIAFSILKSQTVLDLLLKFDWDDEPEDATDEERAMDRLSNRAGGFQGWKGPKRESREKLSEGARRPRGQVGTQGDLPHSGVAGKTGHFGMATRDAARRANKIAREKYEQDKAETRQRRIRMNERDESRTYHPGSLLFDTDELDPSSARLPPRVARAPVELARRVAGRTYRRNDQEDFTRPLGQAYRSEPDNWKDWIAENPELWEDIQAGTINIDRFMDRVDDTHHNEMVREMARQGLSGLDRESGGFVDVKEPMDNVLEEAGRRGHLDDMEHEYFIDEDGEIQVRGNLALPEEEGKALQEHMKNLEDAPTVARRFWVDSDPDRHGSQEDIPTASHTMAQGHGDTWVQSGHGGTLQSRPTFYGLPFNEETGFTLSEPMDIAWDSLLKRFNHR
jgi:hypothetical protein